MLNNRSWLKDSILCSYTDTWVYRVYANIYTHTYTYIQTRVHTHTYTRRWTDRATQRLNRTQGNKQTRGFKAKGQIQTHRSHFPSLLRPTWSPPEPSYAPDIPAPIFSFSLPPSSPTPHPFLPYFARPYPLLLLSPIPHLLPTLTSSPVTPLPHSYPLSPPLLTPHSPSFTSYPLSPPPLLPQSPVPPSPVLTPFPYPLPPSFIPSPPLPPLSPAPHPSPLSLPFFSLRTLSLEHLTLTNRVPSTGIPSLANYANIK